MPCLTRVLTRLLLLLVLVWIPAYSFGDTPPSAPQHIPITEVKVRLSDHGPVVLLQAEGRSIPVFVDTTVALSIQAALNGERLSRPMSHDLMHSILEAYGARVTQAVITLNGGTFYGTLSVAMRGEVKVFDSRSSDSIALAIHFKAPILVGRDLLESAGKVPEQGAGSEL